MKNINYEMQLPWKLANANIPGYMLQFKELLNSNPKLEDDDAFMNIYIELLIDCYISPEPNANNGFKEELLYVVDSVDYVYEQSWMTDKICNYIEDTLEKDADKIAVLLNEEYDPYQEEGFIHYPDDYTDK